MDDCLTLTIMLPCSASPRKPHAAALKRWRRECAHPEWVFPSPRHDGPISNTWVGNQLYDIGRRLGITLHPHLLRHTVATLMLRAGAPLPAIQQFLGHVSLQTTQVYLDVEPSDVEDAVNRIQLSDTPREEGEDR